MDYSLLISPGTPAAQSSLMACWKLLANSPVTLFAISIEAGVEEIRLPYVLSVDMLPKESRRGSTGDVSRSQFRHPFTSFQGESRSVLGVLRLADRAAKSSSSVLLLGESGTGKEVLAKEICDASSRKDKPFLALNCAALSKDLVASELFGHVKGAFTSAVADKAGYLEEADGGTLFLDELGEIPLETQSLLLRFLDSGKFQRVGDTRERRSDVRLIAATNRDLPAAIAANQFRADFLYRINVIPIALPPLRHRGDDVALLARNALASWNAREKPAKPKSLSDEAVAALKQYPWYGNVRELRSAIERIAVLSDGSEITADDVEDLSGATRDATRIAYARLSEPQFLTHLAAITDESLLRYGNDIREVKRMRSLENRQTDLKKQLADPTQTRQGEERGEREQELADVKQQLGNLKEQQKNSQPIAPWKEADYFESWQATEQFFRPLRIGMRRAVIKAVNEVFWGKTTDTKGGDKVPLRLLMLGGDDLVLVCGAPYALPFVVKLANSVRDLTADMVDQQGPITLGAGVAIVPDSFPFYRGHELAEQLTESAKRLKSALANANQDANVVDWMVTSEAWHGDIAETRRRDGIKDGSLALCRKPYPVLKPTTNGETFKTLEGMLEHAKELVRMTQDNRAARSQLQGLVRQLPRGRHTARFASDILPANLKKMLTDMGYLNTADGPWCELSSGIENNSLKVRGTNLLDLLELFELHRMLDDESERLSEKP